MWLEVGRSCTRRGLNTLSWESMQGKVSYLHSARKDKTGAMQRGGVSGPQLVASGFPPQLVGSGGVPRVLPASQSLPFNSAQPARGASRRTPGGTSQDTLGQCLADQVPGAGYLSSSVPAALS